MGANLAQALNGEHLSEMVDAFFNLANRIFNIFVKKNRDLEVRKADSI